MATGGARKGRGATDQAHPRPLSARAHRGRQRPPPRGDARRARPQRVPRDRPRPRRPPHDHRPRQRNPALRGMDGLLIDWGGVLTHSVLGSFAAFDEAEGLPENTIRDAFLNDARPLLEGLENGELSIPEFEQKLAQQLNLDKTSLAARLMAHARPDEEMRQAVRRFHDQGIRTVLVSNSWRESDYDMADAFDAMVLSQQLGIRKP